MMVLLLWASFATLITPAMAGTAIPKRSPALLLAAGGFTPRTSADRAAEQINVRDYGATGDARTDDSAAFVGAIEAANARAGSSGGANTPICIYVPSGRYRISANHLPMFYRNGCILGDGALKSIISVGDQYAGDIFSWSEAWMAQSYPFRGDTIDLSAQAAGPIVKGISIVGVRSAPNIQNAFVFYDRVDFLTMDDVSVDYLRGRALYSGVRKQAPEAYLRESRLQNLRFFNDGDGQTAVVEFSSAGNGDATNEIDVVNLDIYAPYGPGLVIRSENPKSAVRAMKFSNLRIEGKEDNPGGIRADLLVIGDPVATGRVSGIAFSLLELIDPYAGQAAMRLTASSPRFQPYGIRAEGIIGGGKPAGRGLQIDAGRNSYFHFSDIHTNDTAISIAAPPMTGDGIALDGNGAEDRWTYDVDPRALAFVSTPVRKRGVPGYRAAVPANRPAPNAGASDTSTGFSVMRASTSSTTMMRLTTDGQPPGRSNCLQVPPSDNLTVRITVIARDVSQVGNTIAWELPLATLSHGPSPERSVLVAAKPVIEAVGSGAQAKITASADGDNGCLDLDWTAPNEHRWEVTARIDVLDAGP